jgi:hypothetical protein
MPDTSEMLSCTISLSQSAPDTGKNATPSATHCVHAGCELGTLGAADGSASLQLGTTEALVAVYGPRPAESRAAYQNEAQIQATVTFAKFSGMTPKPNQVRCHPFGSPFTPHSDGTALDRALAMPPFEYQLQMGSITLK